MDKQTAEPNMKIDQDAKFIITFIIVYGVLFCLGFLFWYDFRNFALCFSLIGHDPSCNIEDTRNIFDQWMQP